MRKTQSSSTRNRGSDDSADANLLTGDSRSSSCSQLGAATGAGDSSSGGEAKDCDTNDVAVPVEELMGTWSPLLAYEHNHHHHHPHNHIHHPHSHQQQRSSHNNHHHHHHHHQHNSSSSGNSNGNQTGSLQKQNQSQHTSIASGGNVEGKSGEFRDAFVVNKFIIENRECN